MASTTPPSKRPEQASAALAALPVAERVRDALRGEDAWAVGGAVRDALLGRTPRELDVVVIGPVDALAGRIGAVVARHHRFGTATVRTAEGDTVDLASARTETYAAPGALPDVVPARSVEEDLVRRDVTVNAIAVDLADGAMAAAPGALEDLRDGTLRVLHERSFVDDPTRVWRIARYAARLGFAVEPATAALAGTADPFAISGARHGAELRLTLGEPDPGVAFRTLQRLNARFLPPGFDPAPAGLDAALELLPDGARRDLVRLAASCAGVDLLHLLPWVRDCEWSAAEADVIGAGSRASTASPLGAARTPSEIRRAASGVPIEVVALAGGPNARRWIDDLRHVTLEIDGGDVLAAGVEPGPVVGEALRRALDAKLDGRLDPGRPVREAELAVALEGVR